MDEQRVYRLIAAYEELFIVSEKENILEWYGDYHMYIFHGSKNQLEALKERALQALHMSEEEFMRTEDFRYTGNIILWMCKENNLEIPERLRQQSRNGE